MRVSEQGVLTDLVSKWVSLALEYAGEAPDVLALHFYGASEVPGVTHVNVLFDQAGEVVYPTDLVGTDNSTDRAGRTQALFRSDLYEAAEKFSSISVPPPTEYRVYYEPATRKLDVQLSREIIYGGSDYTPGFDGFTLWLGDRAPRVIP